RRPRHGEEGLVGLAPYTSALTGSNRKEPTVMFPLSKGTVTRQAHVGLPEGTFEEEHGREAFDGRVSHLYRKHPPTAWVRIEGPLRPRAYDLNGLKPADMTDAGGDWLRILHS